MWDADAIESDLQRPRTRLGLREDLEAEYDRRAEDFARKQIAIVLSAVALLSLLGLPVDAGTGILSEALLLKLGIHLPVLLIGIVVAWRRVLPADRIWLTGAVPLMVTVGVVTTLAIETTPPMTDRYATIAGIAAFAANVALPMKFRDAAMLTVANVALYIGIPLVFSPFASVGSYLDILCFMSAVALVTTILAYSRERAQKRAFLMDLASDRQMTELQTLVDDLTQLAHRDPLTGAGNRRSFDMRYDATWRAAALRREQVALLLIDVDHFKLFNDAAGHAEGDICLKAIAGSIAEAAGKPLEAVSRFGGEEFAVVLQSTAGHTAEAIRSHVAALAIAHPGLPAGSVVTVSIGKAFTYPGSGKDSQDDLIRAADEALYEAKRGGRNRVVLRGHIQMAA